MIRSSRFGNRRLALLLVVTLAGVAVTCGNSRLPDTGTLSPAAGSTAITESAVPCTVVPGLDGGLACSLEAFQAEVTAYTWRDDFDRENLFPLWQWEREDREHWSLDARPGYLRILTQAGDIWGALANQKNILLQPAPSSDFQITTRIEFMPRFNFQHAGLMVYQDGDNYVHINRGRLREQRINFDLEIDRVATNINLPYAGSSVYLRIARQGTTYAGYYSEDGLEWALAGKYTAALSQARVGISAANNTIGLPADPVDFDYFNLQAEMPGYEQCMQDTFDLEALDPHWAWQNQNPEAWSLTARPGFLRLDSSAGGPGAENLLYLTAPSGDFLLEAQLAFTPTADMQSAGWVAYQDPENYLALGRRYCETEPPTCLGQEVFWEGYENGEQMGSSFALGWGDESEVRLRLLREGQSYSGYVSADGATWNLVGRNTAALAPMQVGLSAWGDPSGQHPPADFNEAVLCAQELPPLETPTPTATHTEEPQASPTPTSPSALQMLYLPVLHRPR